MIEPQPARTRKGQLIMAYLLLTAGPLFLLFKVWVYDDPFITYRYAANLAEGAGFVYNFGERVLSTTSPLMALLLAGLRVLGADIPTSANLIGVLSLSAGGLLLWDICRRLDAPAAGRACALLYPTSALLVSTLGSETPLYLALSLGAFDFYLRRRLTPAAILLALAALTRADALVLGAVLCADWLFRTLGGSRDAPGQDPAAAVRAGSAAAAVLLPWVVFGWFYFGSPLPATLAAKQAQGLMDPSNLFLPGLGDLIGRLAAYPHQWILLGLAPFGIGLAAVRRRRWLPLLLWPVLFTAGYALLGVPRYIWYYASLVPGVLAAAGLVLGALISDRTQPGEAPGHLLTAAGLILLGLLFVGQLSDLNRLHKTLDKRYTIYRQIGLWLSENTPPESSIGTLEVGIIGYFARPRPMIDFTGLLQPEIAAQLRPGGSFPETAVWAAERYHPDVLVLSAGRFAALQDAYVRARCEPAAEFAGVDYGYDRDMVVYVCG